MGVEGTPPPSEVGGGTVALRRGTQGGEEPGRGVW